MWYLGEIKWLSVMLWKHFQCNLAANCRLSVPISENESWDKEKCQLQSWKMASI